MEAVRQEEILSAALILPAIILRPSRRNGSADQALHLVTEARDGSPMSASGLKPKLRHEA